MVIIEHYGSWYIKSKTALLPEAKQKAISSVLSKATDMT